MKNIKQIITIILSFCVCFGVFSSNVFAAEMQHDNNALQTVDYLNYDFPDGAEVLYQAEDGVIYTIQSDYSETSVTQRAVEYNQIWIDAGKTKIGSFTVSNPHRLGGNGDGRLRLESNDPNVKMSVTVSNGSTSLYLGTTTIGVGNDIVFNFNSISSKLVVHYSVVKYSYINGMRLNCWLS